MLTLSEVTYRVGGRTGRRLLDQASAHIWEGGKVGLVGRNGAGKSTLLDLIRGALLPDDGTIDLPRGHRIGFLAQEAPSGAATPLDTVLAADRERTRLLAEREAGPEPLRIAEIETRLAEIGAHTAPSRAARILAGLGLDERAQHEPVGDLSGGFDAYMRARTEAARRLEVMARRQEAERQRLQAFVDRFRAKASKARQAQSRVKALARLEPIVLSTAEPPPRIRFPDPPELRPPLIALDRVSTGYLPGKPVLSRLDLRL